MHAESALLVEYLHAQRLFFLNPAMFTLRVLCSLNAGMLRDYFFSIQLCLVKIIESNLVS